METLPAIREFENKDLLFISYEKTIPSTFRGIVFSLRIDENGHIKIDDTTNQIPDPSTIYTYLPIAEKYPVIPLPYFPHYIDILPEQRFAYLNWLRNIDSPIDTGYVFLYYYGLERHLLTGNFEKAFNQIIRLRNIHKNKSFQNYSEAALIHSCIMKNRLDMLIDLHTKTEISGFSNAQFLLAYNLKMNLSTQNLLQVFNRAFTLSRNALKKNYKLLEYCTEETLSNQYGRGGFPITEYNISKTKTKREIRFANYSFPDEIQFVEITDFYQCKPLMNDIEAIFKVSYEKFKKQTALDRKKNRNQNILT